MIDFGSKMSELSRTKKLDILVRRVGNYFTIKDIDYWADFGTLLGIYRDKDIISWDTDADFSYKSKDRSKVILALSEIIGKTPFQLKILTSSRLRVHYAWDLREEPWLDLYEFVRKDNFYVPIEASFSSFPEYWKINTEILGEIPIIEYKGAEIKVPKNIEARLEYLYKDWKTPTDKGNYWR